MGLRRHWTLSGSVTVCVTIAGVFAACGPKTPDTSRPAAESQPLDSLRATVLQLIGEPMATSVAQCRLTAFGAKPCGGPWAYLVYSTDVTDSTELVRAVAAYTSRESQLNQELGRASDCQLVTPVPVPVYWTSGRLNQAAFLVSA